MRYIPFLLIILIASPAWGGVAAKRMLRMDGEIGYIVSTFTSDATDSWDGFATNGSAAPLSGAFVLTLNGGGTGYASATRTFTNCAVGKLTFSSLRNNNYSLGRVLVDGAPVWAYEGTNSGSWTSYSIDITTGGSHTIKFELPNTTLPAQWSLDNISVPVP